MILILFAVLAILAILWVVAPVISESEVAEEVASRPRIDPASAVLDQIADLDLEYAAGKIPETAYRQVRTDMAVQASAALAAHEESAAAAPSPTASGGGKAKAIAFCPHCGKPVVVQDRFCGACGLKLKA